MLTATHKLEFKSGKRTAKTIVEAGTQPEQPTPARLPRITKMMALAIRLDHLIKSGQVTDQAEIARVGHVTRARLTQIMDLTLLAPDIQEEILIMESPTKSIDCITEKQLRSICANPNWNEQRTEWVKLLGSDTGIPNISISRNIQKEFS
jgi:hypothetical protein